MGHLTKTVKIRDLGRIVTGSTPSTKRSEYYGNGYPFIKPSDIIPGIRRVTSTETMLSELGHRSQGTGFLPRNTTCVVCIGTIGKICLTSEPCSTNQQINSVIPDEERYDPLYVYYLLTTAIPKVKKVEGGSASGREHVNKGVFSQIEVNVHPLPTQRKIAAILSAYDDLIENNTRRITILEEMARLIYREWFVQFRFPGHEGVLLVESEIGLVPEGWEVVRLSEAVGIYRGRSYRSENLVKKGGLPFLSLKSVDRDGGFRLDGLKQYEGPYNQAQAAQPGDIVIAVTDMTQERRIVARAARVPDLGLETFVYSMDLVKIVPNEDVNSNYLYGVLRFSSFSDEVKQYANGANVLHLNPDRIKGFKFALPPLWLRNQYGNFCEDIYHQCDILERKNTNLRRTRDLLLPRLISGEVVGGGLEIAVGE